MKTIARLSALLGRLPAFDRDRRGVAAIEFAIMVPVLVLLFLGVATWFDVARDQARADRATFVVADSVGRLQSVATADLDLMHGLLTNLAKANGTPGIRVTSVSRPLLTLKVDWSYAKTPFTTMRTSDLSQLNFPVSIPIGGSAIIVESSSSYMPMFKLFGSAARTHVGISLARPRLVSVIPKID